jgi:hypothetical protein
MIGETIKKNLPEIKFSHAYLKFGAYELPIQGQILQVFKVNFSELGREFLNYDTRYYDKSTESFQNYPLSKTDHIFILIEIGAAKLVTTMRRWTPEKWKYYKALEGKQVMLVEGRP